MPMAPMPCRMLSAQRERIAMIEEWVGSIGDSEVPISLAALSVGHEHEPEIAKRLGIPRSQETNALVTALGAVTAWSRSQFIFDFDRDMWDALAQTKTDVFLDTDILRRMPSPAIWVEIPMKDGLGDNNGFFAVLDRLDPETKGPCPPELRMRGFGLWLVMVENGPDPKRAFDTQCIILGLGQSLEESMASAYRNMDAKERENVTKIIAPVIASVLYLCSEEPDVEGSMSRMNRQRQARRQPLYGPTMFHVGARLGAIFRKARAEHEAAEARGEAASPLPHMRRAHWHAYWMGPRDKPELRKRVLRWLHPVAVNAMGGSPQAAIRPVRPPKEAAP